MSVVIGIDVGGSTTKIVGFDKADGADKLIEPIFVRVAATLLRWLLSSSPRLRLLRRKRLSNLPNKKLHRVSFGF